VTRPNSSAGRGGPSPSWVPERYGGLGLGLAEAAIVAEGLGGMLAPEPFTAVSLAADVVAGGDNEALKHDFLGRTIEGSLLAVLAWQERAGEVEASGAGTIAKPFEGGWRVTGTKRFIAAAAGADAFVVSACGPQGPMLLLVDRGTPGVTLALDELADGRHFGTLTVEDALIKGDALVASGAGASGALSHALDHAMVLCSAELLGVMRRALDLSLDYLRTRVQFGKPIGSFQALQHRAVDLHIQRELASAVLDETVSALDRDPGAVPRARLASRAKARCADAAMRITREAIQFHGAIGFTDEYDAGLYLKRAMVLANWLGNPAWHRRRYGALGLEAES